MDIAKSAASKISEAERRIEKKLTILWHDLDAWQQDNHYILSGYRPQSNSFVKSAKSLGYIHNETVNIYSHLFGAVLALISGIAVYSHLKPRYETATKEDALVFGCFFLGAISCLGMSAAFHTISNHSHEVSSFGNKLDYLGIVFLIWGSFIPVMYYGFQAEPQLMHTYWTMITTLAAGTSVAAVHPKFRTPALRPFRALMFVLMGLSGVVPVVHGVKLYGLEQMQKTIALNWVVSQGALYILGAVIYAARFPERMRPGSFDIWGSSHQIFHFLVVLAVATHLVGVVKAFDYEHSQRGGAAQLGVFEKIWH
ncbi:hemolysin-III related-domain-containing protein [Massariosphaeria phaeospora]|uniref:Hemolysin-III related-domain-containing protein n=1 Tax=Massariosphaeria phaeospora TaxID=100035 RepID=A0A7C8IB34_9PLEO|nr:hemolysin-III related-domain-containing protein [Massariosphaeria phaeospora]